MKGRHLLILSLLSLLFFIPLFTFIGIGQFDFWWWMSTNLVVLITLGLILDKAYLPFLRDDYTGDVLKKIGIGLLSVVILYFVFYFGNWLSRELFDFASGGIENVYAFKGNASATRISILMLLIIGPGEEIFWRGLLQRNLAKKLGPKKGFILATFLYTLVHVFTGNIMLILAALICGLFWGWLYMKYESMLMNVVSHTLWDLAVFILLPYS